MNITVESLDSPVSITIISTEGHLDGKSYQTLIDKAHELYTAGSINILLDMSGTEYISSAGLVALQSIAQLMRGDDLLDTEAGWSALRAVGADTNQMHRKHFKLVNPQPQVDKALDMVGFKDYFDIYSDRDEAARSFAE